MADLVVPVKWESPSSGGTQQDTTPSGANPHEDGIAARAVFLQPETGGLDKVVGITRRDSGTDLVLFDAHASVVLSDLVSSGAIFGSDYQLAWQGNAWAYWSGASWHTVLSLSFSALGGEYRVACFYEWGYFPGGGRFKARLRDGGADIAQENVVTDKAQDVRRTGVLVPRTYFSGQSVQIELQVRPKKSWHTVKVRRAVIEVFRTST